MKVHPYTIFVRLIVLSSSFFLLQPLPHLRSAPFLLSLQGFVCIPIDDLLYTMKKYASYALINTGVEVDDNVDSRDEDFGRDEYNY